MYSTNVYYTDASCNPNNTLKNLDKFGIYNIVPMDCMALVTVTPQQIAVVAEIDYETINLEEIIKLVPAEDIFKLSEPQVYSFAELNILFIPVRNSKHYRVFFACTKPGKYEDIPIATMNIIMKLLCENAYLKNEIMHEEDYLANILDSSESIIISINLAGEITTANKSAYKFFGKKGIIGSNISTLMQDNINDMISYVISTNKSINQKEIIILSKRGRKVIMHITLSALQNSKGKIVGVVIIATNITEKKILENQLEQHKQFAVLGEVAAGVAHDIKNPLMSIRGCAKVLLKELSGQSDSIKFLNPIIQQVDRINEVVNQMISYGHSMQESVHTLININQILEECINIIHFHKGSRNITIKKEFQIVPFLRGNNTRLQQAFLNILMNAVQAIDNDGIITIKTFRAENRNGIFVSISDNGIGIASRDIKKIFRPYYTTKQPTRGLGLSIVQNVIKEHKGKIAIHSVLHEGTIIDVFLPCSKVN